MSATEPILSGRHTPSVAVVIAAHNGERFLEAALESVCRQTLSDLEIIVVDDSSSDGTRELVSSVAATDHRVRCIEASVGSAGAARNIGWRASRARYIANLDQDDLAQPDRLERQARFLDANAEIGLVGAFCYLIDARGARHGNLALVSDADEVTNLLRTGALAHITHATAMFRRSILEEVGGYKEIPGTAVEDYDLFLRIAERYRVANVPAYLGAWRVHAANSSQDVIDMARWVLAVRAASRLRLRGQADPMETWHDLRTPTDAQLVQLGVSSDELRRAVFGGHLQWVDLLLAVRDPGAAMEHVVAARSALDTRGLDDRTAYLVARSRTEFALGCPLRSFGSAVAAFLLSPRVASRSLAHPVVGGIGKSVYGRLPAGGGVVGRSVRTAVVKRLNRVG